jgi:myo-inositol-1-phosphate synthase
MKNQRNSLIPPQNGEIAEIEVMLGRILRYASELNELMSSFISLSRKYAQDFEDILKKCQKLNAEALSRSFDSKNIFYALTSLKNMDKLTNQEVKIIEKIDTIFHQIDALKENIEETYALIINQRKQEGKICKNGLDSMLESITSFLDFLWRLEIDENKKEVAVFWKGNNEVYTNLLRCYHNLIEKLNQMQNF